MSEELVHIAENGFTVESLVEALMRFNPNAQIILPGADSGGYDAVLFFRGIIRQSPDRDLVIIGGFEEPMDMQWIAKRPLEHLIRDVIDREIIED